MYTTGQFVGALSALYVLLWIPVAWMTGVLLPDQMLKKYPEPGQVIPLIVDFYLWGDLLLFCPLMGYIIDRVGIQWSMEGIGVLFVLGLVAAVAFQYFVIVPGKYPSTLGGAGRTTLIGYLHIPFFATVFTVMMLFLCTSVPPMMVFIIATVVAVIVPINMLVPLHCIRQWLGLVWAPDVVADEPRLFLMIKDAWAGIAVLTTVKLVVQHHRW